MCFDIRSTFNTTRTPSGNFVFVSNGRISSSVTSGGVTTTFENVSHVNRVFRPGETHVVHQRLQASFQVGPGPQCTTTQTFHEVDGQIQFSDVEVTCVP